jgi:hypothetical protein
VGLVNCFSETSPSAFLIFTTLMPKVSPLSIFRLTPMVAEKWTVAMTVVVRPWVR